MGKLPVIYHVKLYWFFWAFEAQNLLINSIANGKHAQTWLKFFAMPVIQTQTLPLQGDLGVSMLVA